MTHVKQLITDEHYSSPTTEYLIVHYNSKFKTNTSDWSLFDKLISKPFFPFRLKFDFLKNI